MPNLHKSNRSLGKRIKVTGSGKVTKRKPRQNHFNAKDSGDTRMGKRGLTSAPNEHKKHFQELLPGKNIKS